MNVVLDDRLLIEQILVGIEPEGASLHTTSYWYYRACRAAVLGASGQLSGPFAEVPDHVQSASIAALLRLPQSIGLPDSRAIVPVMVGVAARHPRLNLLNLEATAVARHLDATVWLSPRATAGVLPKVLDEEHLAWREVALAS